MAKTEKGHGNGSDRLSCSDCNAFNDFIVCDQGRRQKIFQGGQRKNTEN